MTTRCELISSVEGSIPLAFDFFSQRLVFHIIMARAIIKVHNTLSLHQLSLGKKDNDSKSLDLVSKA